jgi:predicted O-linked N-acetylglucosamine transferase (SPINDLY family)
MPGALPHIVAQAAEHWHELGRRHLARWEYGAALAALRHAAELAPQPGALDHDRGQALFELGHVDAAIGAFRRAADAGDAALREAALRSIAVIIPGAPEADHQAVLAARRDWAPRPMPPPSRHTQRGTKLRIGYVSAYFGSRNWMKPVWGLINHHDRSAFEVHMFADRAGPDAASGYRDAETDVIHTVNGIDNARLAGIIESARIDILVDLNGYSVADRLGLFALRPAPVIVGWFNMFATTGMAAFDWLVGDASVIPPDEAAQYAERIHRLPGSYLAFDVLYPVPPVAPPPSLQSGCITFGCLGSQHKLTDPVLAAWGEILRAAPAAQLLVRNATLEDTSSRDDLLARLAREGIDATRVTLGGRADHLAFLRSYDRIDIALDTFPYNGGTTTTEALWQGVPVLTFNGDRWASRTSRSILLAAGLSEWVTRDTAGYVQRAATLANDPATPAMLAALRTGMRARLRASAACDTTALCRAMEAFYQQVASGQ